MKTFAVFVDVQNIYYTCRQAYNRQFNYRLFWQQLQAAGQINKAIAYAIARPDDQQRKFQDALRHIGFEIKLKPFIQRSDGSAKGDWDVGITIDMLNAVGQAEEFILLSGDGDFDLLMQELSQHKQVKTAVYSVPQLTAQSLINSVDQWHPITDALLL